MKIFIAPLQRAMMAFVFLSSASFIVPVQAEEETWGPNITTGAKIGNQRDLYSVELFSPLKQDDDTLLFSDIRFRTDPGDDWEGNVGFGIRRIYNRDKILGAYGFVDFRQSPSNNKFRQITLGAEYLTETWDFRVNTYLPERGKKLVSHTATASLSGSQVFLENSQNFEKAMPGVDAEVGYKIPTNDIDTRVFVGGYHFWDDDLENVTGLRGRAEVSIENQDRVKYLPEDAIFRVSAETQYDDIRDGNHFAGAEISIPLYSVPKRKSMSGIERRMTNPIVRDIDIVTSPSVTTAPPEAAEANIGGVESSSVYIVEAEDTATFEAAVSALPEDSLIIVANSAPIVVENTIALKANQSVVGAGAEVAVQAGAGPTIGYIANASANSELIRSNALYGSSQPIFTLADAGNHSFRGVTLTNENESVGGTQMMITAGGNTPESVVIDNVSSSSGVQIDITSGSSNVTVTNSEIHGIDLRTRNDSSMVVTIKDNIIDRMSNVARVYSQNITSSLFIEAMNTSTMVVEDISGNIIRDQFSEIGGRAALGAGFLHSSSTPMQVNKMTDNTISRTDEGSWDAGSVLGQGVGGDIIYFSEFHDNSVNNNGSFTAVGSRVNIGQEGFSADEDGFEEANSGMTFGDFDNNVITNDLP